MEEYDLTGVNRIQIILEKPSDPEYLTRSYLVEGQPSAQLRLPASYAPTETTNEMTPADEVTIGPDPDNTTVSFIVQAGEDQHRYLIVVTANTSTGARHMCAITFEVSESVIWPD